MTTRRSERRTQVDRRKASRGGRRPDDQPGTTPLVLVVGHAGAPQRESEVILRELRFAVAPAVSMEEALRVVEGLHPDVVVAQSTEASRLRAAAAVDVPIVEYDGTAPDAGDLVARIREAIRKRR